jgi:hypothetical protein
LSLVTFPKWLTGDVYGRYLSSFMSCQWLAGDIYRVHAYTPAHPRTPTLASVCVCAHTHTHKGTVEVLVIIKFLVSTDVVIP